MLRAAFLFLLALAFGQSAANPFALAHFSATLAVSGASLPGMTMKIYRSGNHCRTDMPGGGYSVADLGTSKMFMVMPGGMCLEMPARMSAGRGPNPFATRGAVTVEPLGTATLDGHPCRVERVTATAPGEAPQVMKVWSATDLRGFPLRVEMQARGRAMQLDYKDVSLAAPDASLFAQPANCRKMPGMPGR